MSELENKITQVEKRIEYNNNLIAQQKSLFFAERIPTSYISLGIVFCFTCGFIIGYQKTIAKTIFSTLKRIFKMRYVYQIIKFIF